MMKPSNKPLVVAAAAAPIAQGKSIPQLFDQCIKEYGIDVEDFIKLYVLSFLLKEKGIPKPPIAKKDEPIYFSLLNTFLGEIPFQEFTDKIILGGNKVLPNSQWNAHFIAKFTIDWFTQLRSTSERQMDKYRESLATLNKSSIFFEKIKPLVIHNERPLGNITNFRIKTKETTGSVFNRLRLRPEFPIARYKTFFKIFVYNQEFLKKDMDEIPEEFDHHLRILNPEGKVFFYLETIEEGLMVQGIFMNDSAVHEISSLLVMLGLENEETDMKKSKGIMTEFSIHNRLPSKELSKKWSPLDSSIFSNLCMNDPICSKFFKVNDTDKISRSNHSVFIYYSELTSKKRPEQEIHVGGWNKISSRFGDLTAILTPEQKKLGEYTINIKITRSINEKVVVSFKSVIAKIIQYYNTIYAQQYDTFKIYDPSFNPFFPELEKETKKMEKSDTHSRIFSSHDYSRKCQAPPPISITVQEASRITDPSRKLLFPPIPDRDGEFQPQWYTCDQTITKNDNTFPYPGLIKLDKSDHPFGYAPCCYVESHLENNKKKAQDIVYTIRNGIPIDFDKTINLTEEMKTKKRDIETNKKIINSVGQVGILPKPIEIFMSIMKPSRYVRMGTSRWKYDSFVGCLEFRRALRGDKIMKSPKTIRTELVKTRLEVGLQQNYDIGVPGILEMLEDPNRILDPRRMIRIVEEYYKVNIFIFIKRGETIEILAPHNYKEYYFEFWETIAKRPIVFLLEHSGEKTRHHYEMIAHYDEKNQLQLDLDCHQEYKTILYQALGSFSGDRFTTIPKKQKGKCEDLLSHQILDFYGKARVLVFSKLFPALLCGPIAPLALAVLDKPLRYPSLQQFTDFSQHYQLQSKKAYRIGEVLLFQVKDFLELYFIVHVGKGQDALLKQLKNIEELPDDKKDLLQILRYTEKDSNQFYKMKQNMRLANILQDYCLYYFSLYMKENYKKLTLTTVGTFMDAFFENQVSFLPWDQLGYQSIDNFHTRIKQQDCILTRDKKKIKLPRELKSKLVFFLKWFSMTKSRAFEFYKNYIELPSYFQFSSDFQFLPNHIIQTSLEPFVNRSYQPYRDSKLDDLWMRFGSSFFYYNAMETPEPYPYLCIIFENKQEGIEKVSYFCESESWTSFQQSQQVRELAYGEGRRGDNGLIQWTPKDKKKPARFWIFERDTTSVFLIPRENL